MDLEQSQKKNCPRCGKARTERGGSITQWISACNCSDAEIENGSLPPSTVCPTCGKRQEKGRSGSFTQWVFRQDLCCCQQTIPDNPSELPPELEPSEENRASEIDEVELAVNPETFPIERYKPLAELGKGAAGTVYLCRDRLLRVKVAVKVLNVLTSDKLMSFQNEAKATSKLNHPGIIKIMDFGATESGYPYMVMERFQGESLESFMKENGVLPMSMAISIFTDVAAALEYAHEKGVFHRDIKPSNLLLRLDTDEYPQMKVIDFGVAQLEAASQEPTVFQGRTLVGTPQYMSPDQANGLAYDERSEVYSLGCVLFEALAGTPPFEGETALEIISKHANDIPDPLSECAQDDSIPASLDAIVSRMLSKDPEQRIQNMTELKKELTRALQPDRRASASMVSQPTRPKVQAVIVFALVGLGLAALSLLSWTSLFGTNTEVKKRSIRARKDSLFDPLPIRTDLSGITLRKTASRKRIEALDPVKFQVAPKQFITTTSLCSDDDLHVLKGLRFTSLQVKNCTDKTIKKLRSLNMSVRGLNLDRSAITDECIKDINAIPSIEELTLSSTAISDRFLQQISLPSLRSLDLDNCRITDAGLLAISKRCRSIARLELSNTQLTAAGLKHLNRLRRLHSLYLSNMPITGETIDSLKTLSFPTLYMTEARMSADTLRRLPEIKSLKTVELSHVSALDKPMSQWLKSKMPDCQIFNQQLEANNQLGEMQSLLDSINREELP